jgi:hypothetical protein
VLCQSAAATQPREGALHDPASRQHFKATGLIGSLHDLDGKLRQRGSRPGAELRALAAAISAQFHQTRIQAKQGGQHQHATVAVLNIGGMHDRMQQQAYRVDQDMPLPAFDLLARVIAVRIDAAPPFSALLPLWLPITQAVGLASRATCSRHLTYSV